MRLVEQFGRAGWLNRLYEKNKNVSKYLDKAGESNSWTKPIPERNFITSPEQEVGITPPFWMAWRHTGSAARAARDADSSQSSFSYSTDVSNWSAGSTFRQCHNQGLFLLSGGLVGIWGYNFWHQKCLIYSSGGLVGTSLNGNLQNQRLACLPAYTHHTHHCETMLNVCRLLVKPKKKATWP